MAKKRDESRFIADIPEMVETVTNFKQRTLDHPAIPYPWPAYVDKPEILDREVASMVSIWEAIGDENVATGGELGRARVRVKTRFSKLARYASLALQGGHGLDRWPGFDVARNPGEARCRAPYPTPDSAAETEND